MAVSVSTIVGVSVGNPWFEFLPYIYLVFGVEQILETGFIVPRVVGKHVGLHPLLVMMSLLIFGFMFGFLGLIIAVPTVALMSIFYQQYKDSGKISFLSGAELDIFLQQFEAEKKEIIENKPSNTELNYGIRITATASISAYYELASANNPEIFPLKGNVSKGLDFIIPAQTRYNNQTYAVFPAHNGFAIVATEDNTTINIDLTRPDEKGNSKMELTNKDDFEFQYNLVKHNIIKACPCQINVT